MDVFIDLETLTVNRRTKTPSQLKTVPYSVAYAINKSNKVHIKSNIQSCLTHISELCNSKNIKKVNIYAHNSSKYDSHFILWELLNIGFTRYLNLKSNMNTPDNCLFNKQPDIQNNEVLELRYKSSNKLSLVFKLNDILFEVIDTFPKTILSLENIGKKLHQLKLLDEKYLKSDFDYLKYDLYDDLNSDELFIYSNNIINLLTSSEIQYIKNDVIILQTLVNNFSKFFDGFSIKEFALNGNVINNYTSHKKDKLATHHILNKIYDKRADNKKYFDISYGNYELYSGCNLFKFFKSSYRGGVCFYNDNYINETITDNVVAYDINSSYPSILYKNKVPHVVIDYKHGCSITLNDLSYKITNTYSIISISLAEFKKITNGMRTVFKKINNSYYKTHQNIVHVNSLFIDELLYIHSFNSDVKINIIDVVTFNLCEWGGKKYLKKFYEIKQNSKRFNKNRLVMGSNGNMIETNDIIKDDESYLTDVSKVNLNSIYGASGISDYVDFFYHDAENNLIRHENGIKNIERNIVSSLFVTSFAKYNLLYPLKDLTNKQLDDAFLYCDTDSLYFKKSILKYIINNIDVDDNNIGSWSCDSENISKFKILNHKIYSYYDSVKNKITCKMCGVSKKTISNILVKCNNNWDEFSNNYFYPTSELPSIKSILNKSGTISIYDSITILKAGDKYNDDLTFSDRIKFFNTIDLLYNSFNNDIYINDVSDLNSDDDSAKVYYINGGAYSKQDIIQIYNEVNNIILDEYVEYLPINELINVDYPYFLSKMEDEPIDYNLVVNLINSTEYNHKKLNKSKFKYTVKYPTNHSYIYLKSLYALKLFNLKSLKNREHDILKTMLKFRGNE